MAFRKNTEGDIRNNNKIICIICKKKDKIVHTCKKKKPHQYPLDHIMRNKAFYMYTDILTEYI